MLRAFLKRLVGEGEGDSLMTENEARIAMAAVLVRAARADNDYAEVEKSLIDEVLMERYGISAAQAAMLRSEGEMAEAEAVDLVRFTRVIKEDVPYEERESVVRALWTVVLGDGKRDPHEDAHIRQVIGLIGVSDRDSAHARQDAMEDLGIREEDDSDL